MTQGRRESLRGRDVDLFDGDDAHPAEFLFGADEAEQVEASSRSDERRSVRARRRRSARRGWLFVLVVVVIVAVAAVIAFRWISDRDASAPDYSGSGTGTVDVLVTQGDLTHIGQQLQAAGVVRSVAAFTAPADNNSNAESIQPGRYALAHHMSAAAAVDRLLDPAARLASANVVVTEGATTLDVIDRLARCYGAGKVAQIRSELASPGNLSLPVTYQVGARFPATSEGFLYPATYPCDPGTSTSDALTAMVLRFVQQDRDTDFATDAKAVKLTPYQALIVASIAQSEARFPADMPKVVRVILNRISTGQRTMQFDSTSSYACKLAGTPVAKCIYNQVDSPYNTYTHAGLPPTPIDNPGAEAMAAAVHPASGSWMWFVNIDAAGHLGFFDTAAAFEKARATCEKNNWGCGG